VATDHPSNDIASNIALYFAAPTVADGDKQAKLDSLSTDFQALANKIVADVCACADRSTSLRRLRESFELSCSSIVEEQADPNPSWPPDPNL
jgi:hypothetical protein